MARLGRPATSPETPTLSRTRGAVNILAWGSFPQIVLLGACGVLTVALANFAAVQGASHADLLFWLGLALIFIPFAVRLISAAPTRGERLALVLSMGLALYSVKLLHSPVAFTFPDEFVHLRNVNEILETGQLFNTNGMLPATPYYPGLEIVTAALASLGGLSPFVAGIVVIGATRLLILLALFFIYEELSNSMRVASIGVLVYMANSNYLFWTAQFSYESLSLPLAVVVLYLLLLRMKTNQRLLGAGLTLVTLLVLLAVIITHHLTAYVLCAALWAWVLLYRARGIRETSGLARMALIATLGTLAWLLWIATPTVGYLSPVFNYAFEGILRLVQDTSTARELFRSETGAVSPLWERFVSLGAVAALLALLPLGWFQIYRNYRDKPLALLLGITALAYPLLLPLRLTRESWEISNRTSEFIFVGIAFVVAVALVDWQTFRHADWYDRFTAMRKRFEPLGAPIVVTLLLLLLFVSGVTTGWPPNARVGGAYHAAVGSTRIYPQGVTSAEWARKTLDENQRVASDYVNGRLLVGLGNQYPLTGEARGIRTLLNSPVMDAGMLEILRTNRLQYVLVDRRVGRGDPLVGLYFQLVSAIPGIQDRYVDPATHEKFDRARGVWRVYDSGDIIIYQVEALSGYSPPK